MGTMTTYHGYNNPVSMPTKTWVCITQGSTPNTAKHSVYTCLYASMCARTHTCTHTRMHAHMHAHTLFPVCGELRRQLKQRREMEAPKGGLGVTLSTVARLTVTFNQSPEEVRQPST